MLDLRLFRKSIFLTFKNNQWFGKDRKVEKAVKNQVENFEMTNKQNPKTKGNPEVKIHHCKIGFDFFLYIKSWFINPRPKSMLDLSGRTRREIGTKSFYHLWIENSTLYPCVKFQKVFINGRNFYDYFNILQNIDYLLFGNTWDTDPT